MDTDDILLFTITASAGSLSAAARRMGISSMAATRRLAALEAELGVRLMQRTTRSLSLTAEGASFLPYARSMVESADEARAMLHGGHQDASGLLRVSVPVAFGRKIVAPMIPGLLEANPQLSVELEMTDSLPDLVANGTDLAIRIARLRDSSMVARKLADNPRYLVAAPQYLARAGKPADLASLKQHDCLPLSSAGHWTFTSRGKEIHFRPGGRFTASSVEGCHAACMAGAGIALLSGWNTSEDIAAKRLERIELADGEPEQIAIWAVYPTARLVPPKVRIFIAALEDVLGTHQG